MNRLVRIVALAIAVLVGAATPALAAPTPFRATDLGSLGPFTASSAWAINDKNQIAGTAVARDGTTHGVVWRPDGSIRDLGVGVHPADINNLGTIVGAIGQGSSADGFVLQKNVMQDLDVAALPFKVNDQGQMLLKHYSAPLARWVYYFRDSDRLVTEFPEGYQLNDLNDWGQVIGTYRGATKPSAHAFVWQTHVGTIKDFGPASEGLLLNNRGHIVRTEIVFCEGCPGDYSSQIYYYAGGVRKFIAGGLGEVPMAMNDKGQVVGSFSSLGGALAAWFWGPNAGKVNLQYKDSVNEIAARDINETTQIAGVSEYNIVPDPPGENQPVSRATRWTR